MDELYEVELIDGEIYSLEDGGLWYLYIDGAMRELTPEESRLMLEKHDEVIH